MRTYTPIQQISAIAIVAVVIAFVFMYGEAPSRSAAVAAVAASLSPDPMLTNERVGKTGPYGTVPDDCGKTIALGGAKHYTLTLNPASTYPATCSFLIVNEDSTRGKSISFNGTSMRLYPLQSATVFNQNGTWYSTHDNRWKLPYVPLYLYVDAQNGNDGNDGLVPGAGGALRTIPEAFRRVVNDFDFRSPGSNQSVRIQLANGVYSSGVRYVTRPFGAEGGAQVILQGNTANPSATVISTSGEAVGVYGTTLQVRDLKVETNSSGHCIVASASALVYVSNVIFGNCASAHMYADKQAYIEIAGNYTITGSAAAHIQAIDTGAIKASGAEFTISGAPHFSLAFAFAADAGLIKYQNITWRGGSGVTGKRYEVYNNAVIAGATSQNYFPGSVPGTTSQGGVY